MNKVEIVCFHTILNILILILILVNQETQLINVKPIKTFIFVDIVFNLRMSFHKLNLNHCR